MTLSPYEKQELDSIEAQLTAESPRMATSLAEFRPCSSTGKSQRRILRALALAVGSTSWLIGLWLGRDAGPVIAVVGCLVFIAAVTLAFPMSIVAVQRSSDSALSPMLWP
jgi:hypothetical protein